jgi:hypothetical protein
VSNSANFAATRSFFVILAFCSSTALACNAPFMQSGTSATSVAAASAASDDGSRPQVVIEAPVNGAQAVVQQPLTVKVHATDSSGITRVEMRESGRIVSSQPSPSPAVDFTALLGYRPTNVGSVTLEIVAYRQAVASDPVTITVQIVAASDLINPVDPTTGANAGVICVVRVNISNLNLRAGPGTTHRVLTTLQVGEQMNVTGRNADSSWYQIKRSNNTSGWVSAAYVSPDRDCSSAPVTTPAP